VKKWSSEKKQLLWKKRGPATAGMRWRKTREGTSEISMVGVDTWKTGKLKKMERDVGEHLGPQRLVGWRDRWGQRATTTIGKFQKIEKEEKETLTGTGALENGIKDRQKLGAKRNLPGLGGGLKGPCTDIESGKITGKARINKYWGFRRKRRKRENG